MIKSKLSNSDEMPYFASSHLVLHYYGMLGIIELIDGKPEIDEYIFNRT